MQHSYKCLIAITSVFFLILSGCSTTHLKEDGTTAVPDKNKVVADSPLKENKVTEILGIALGEKLTGIPECKTNSEVTCYQRNQEESRELNTEVLNIKWGTDNKSEMIGVDKMSVGLIDGVVHEIKLETKGLLYQKRVAIELERMFGSPMIDKLVKIQIESGGVFDSIYQVWYFKNKDSISFLGITRKLSNGYIILLTDRMLKIKVEEIRRNNQLLE